MKLLEKMGYRGGGLGKNAQGIVAPIEVKLRPKNMGIGFNDYKEQEPIEEIKVFPQKEKTWLKQGVLKKKEKEYITAEELLMKKQEQGLDVVEKVFDMRGPQVRVMTSLENLNAEEEQEEEKSSPIQHNIRLIVAWAKLDMKKIMWDLRKEKETVVTLQKEKEKLKDDATRQKKQLDSMEEMVYVVERLTKESLLGTLTLESVSMSFGDL
ncbi:unnamed protein product [Lactuca virosa]|uniref:G-patch domain-containing protein n=1 Tax=Lactuca virosa TaxID=75947 RepID=A0AAU9NG71_9ASTR|nr:unnamed protein product [Lactuca virosa]